MYNIDEELKTKLKNLDIEELRRDKLGPFNFESLNPKIKEFYNFLKFFIDLNSKFLPDSKYQELENILRNFISITDKIKIFDPESMNNPATGRDDLVRQMDNHWNSFLNNFHSWHSYLSIKSGDLEEKNKKISEIEKKFNEKNEGIHHLMKDYEGLLTNFSKQSIKAKEKIDNLLKETKDESKRIIEDVKKFSAKDVVQKYSKIFEDQAEKEHRPKIKNWRIAFIISLIGEVVLGIVLIIIYAKYFINTNISTSVSVSIALMKIFILSGGAIFVSHTIKNLNAHNHLYTLNKFRSNALASFQAFINSSSGAEDIKDALLIQVSKAIYDPNVSGYLSKDDSHQIGTGIEIIKKMIDGK